MHKQNEGKVLTVAFKINGQPFTALNGGPIFHFSEAISFQVYCETQAEIDFYWEKLSEQGEEGQYGWIKDHYDISWQIIPSILPQLMTSGKAPKIAQAFLQMKKFDLDALLKI